MGGIAVRVVVLAVAAAATAGGAAAGAVPPSTERVALADSGAQPDADVSSQASVTPDGRYVVFASSSPSLAPGAAGGTGPFVYLRDRQLGRTELVSRAAGGGAPNGGSGLAAPVISADGRYVAFASSASNLVAGDTNGAADVFVVDRQTGTTTRASVSSAGDQAAGASSSPSLSADGRVVAFQSTAPNLVPGDGNGTTDVFVHDLQTAATARASVGPAGADAHGASTATSGALSADGRYVAFTSAADNLVVGDANGTTQDVFLRDLQAGTTELAGLGSTGAQPAGGTINGFAGAGGRYVVFQCPTVCGAVPGNHVPTAIFVRDRATGAVREATVSTGGEEAGSSAFVGGVSADGRHVAFATNAANLASPATGNFDFYVHDDDTGTTERVSVSSAGAAANDSSITSGQVVGAAGRFVLFTSTATNLVPDDTNRARDAFVRDRGAAEEPDVTPPSVGPLAFGASPLRVHSATTLSASAADDRSGVAAGEWFAGPDPGPGHGTAMSVSGSTLSAPVGPFDAAAVLTVCVRARDAAGNWSAPSCGRLPVFDPDAGWVSGRGVLDTPAGDRFVLRARYQHRAVVPTGKTRLRMGAHGPVLRATGYDWLVVSGDRAEVEGHGTIDGAGHYGFRVTAFDGATNRDDRLRIEIWDEDRADATVYDNLTTALTRGSITIH